MDVKTLLFPKDALVDVRAPDKARLLQDLAGHAAAALNLDRGLVAGELQKREELGSTGIGKGVALPHARIEGLDKPFGVLARLRKPIDFDAIDGEPVDIVFLLLLPATSGGEPLNALACVSRKLREDGTLRGLRRAEDGAAFYRVAVAQTAKP
ncbi:MAG: PTS sugar transporter subunit IIA [Methylobacteriaceae bacterium]|nr:PTS sugar transporter subunit IIA [Methylobacteriaceae bacterium]MBV9222133.1 PTS sugar transporter subunit IIA [Methylobacteriaceae bacterium]MBV9245753.1 PTS sugar transporter subunit IIA [Methylobacteriaceae bacterium]MBV9635401.1 PTS sugar transporter subunit IIA [Methylobacteriaceae bacterium]MBV9701285.1 PTS sugar transporter subunit IIA [Methylobacteriaceae bacterium]